MKHKNWNGFRDGHWQESIDVRDFIQQNYRPYEGDDRFLSGATERTKTLMSKVEALFTIERQFGGVLDKQRLRSVYRQRLYAQSAR